MLAINDLIWPYHASAMGMRPDVAQAAGVDRVRDVDQAIGIMLAYAEERRTIIEMPEGEASALLRAKLERVSTL